MMQNIVKLPGHPVRMGQTRPGFRVMQLHFIVSPQRRGFLAKKPPASFAGRIYPVRQRKFGLLALRKSFF
jgi:hypothetical protein